MKEIIGQYELRSVLGGGGMATVYRGEHVSGIGMSAAVKKLHPHLAVDAELRARLKVEAQALARLKHPNVVQLFDYVDSDEVCALVTELVEGRTLRAVMNDYADRPMPVSRAIHLFRQVLAGVSHAHSQGCLHRDIKPTNVMVTADDRVKVLDFGIANLVDTERLTRTGVSIGTPVYMPPEQFEGMEGVDERADVFSLGVTFWELLAGPGARPIGQKGWRLDADDVLALEAKGVPPAVIDVVQAMVHPERESRMPSCEEALGALDWAYEASVISEVSSAGSSIEVTIASEERSGSGLSMGPEGATSGEPSLHVTGAANPRPPLLTRQSVAVLVVLVAGVGLWELGNRIASDEAMEVYSIPAASPPLATPPETTVLSSASERAAGVGLRLTSTPAGAWLHLDDAPLGRAPASAQVDPKPATYAIRAELAGYRPAAAECVVQSADLDRGFANCNVVLEKLVVHTVPSSRPGPAEPKATQQKPDRRPDIAKIGD